MTGNYEDNKLTEEAIKFLVFSIDKSGHNPKPVILHSLRMAMRLEALGYNQDIVRGAILHDLLEDTEVTSEEIKKMFGDRVAGLVVANSFQKNIVDEVERYQKMYVQCLKYGREALIIKAADILDNSYYYGAREDLLEKMKYFIDLSAKELAGEKVFNDLVSQYERLQG